MLRTEKFGALIPLSLEGKGRKGKAGSYRIHGKHQSPERSWRLCGGPRLFSEDDPQSRSEAVLLCHGQGCMCGLVHVGEEGPEGLPGALDACSQA